LLEGYLRQSFFILLFFLGLTCWLHTQRGWWVYSVLGVQCRARCVVSCFGPDLESVRSLGSVGVDGLFRRQWRCQQLRRICHVSLLPLAGLSEVQIRHAIIYPSLPVSTRRSRGNSAYLGGADNIEFSTIAGSGCVVVSYLPFSAFQHSNKYWDSLVPFLPDLQGRIHKNGKGVYTLQVKTTQSSAQNSGDHLHGVFLVTTR